MHTTSPSNGEGSTVRPASPLNTNQTSSLNCAGACVGEQGQPESYPKRLATLQAKFALAGFSLYPLTGDELLCTRWAMHRTLPSIEAAEAFLRQVGGGRNG